MLLEIEFLGLVSLTPTKGYSFFSLYYHVIATFVYLNRYVEGGVLIFLFPQDFRVRKKTKTKT